MDSINSTRPEDFDGPLATLKAVAADLKHESDSINEIIASVEAQIVASNIGLEHWIELEYDDLVGPVTELGWAKVNDRWRLAVRLVGTYRTKELASVSRSMRIRALSRLSKLIEELSWQAAKTMEIIRKAKCLL